MAMLDKKLLRDLWRLRGQSAAIALMVACAVATYVASISTYRSLNLSQSRYYGQYRFADAFATLHRAPEEVAARLLDIPGVTEVQTRVAAMASLEVAGIAEPATALIVSIPDGGQPRLNRVFLREGRMPDPMHPWEVLVHEAFAAANRLHPGDRLPATIRGHRHDLRIVGIALAPDFVYTVRPGEIMPDDRRFGVFWAQRRSLGAKPPAFRDPEPGLRPPGPDYGPRCLTPGSSPPAPAAGPRLLAHVIVPQGPAPGLRLQAHTQSP